MEEKKHQIEDLKYLIGLSSFAKFGPVRLKKIKKYFPSYQSAFESGEKELASAGIEENIIHEFTAARNNIDLDKIIESLTRENIKIITPEDANYPRLLREIYNPPEIIYYKGQLNKKDEFSLAIVGTRKYTIYGQRAGEQITKELIKNNLTIISGLALGIDSLVHDSAVKAGGRTVAVLGCGIDKQSIYPSTNRYLAEKIISSGGAVISEFPIGTPPLKHHFPQRNRIISGLSLGTLVIEAGEKSGALITAKYALEQNREVFAVPGSIYSPVSVGPNNLIKQGAKPVNTANDIIEALNLAKVTTYIKNKEIIPESKEEETIVAYLKNEPVHINDLIRLTKLDTNVINSTLIIMEMKGMIKNLGNMHYILAR